MADSNTKGPDRWLIALLSLGALLIFWDLGGRDLWEDEAHTALLARSILARGLPYAYDGLNWVTAEAGRDLDQNHLWRWSPWLQFYAAAAAMKVAGAAEAVGPVHRDSISPKVISRSAIDLKKRGSSSSRKRARLISLALRAPISDT